MKLTINTIPCHDVNLFYKDAMENLICDECDTKILESENVFTILYHSPADGTLLTFHTHNSQDCLKPWINSNPERLTSGEI